MYGELVGLGELTTAQPETIGVVLLVRSDDDELAGEMVGTGLIERKRHLVGLGVVDLRHQHVLERGGNVA